MHRSLPLAIILALLPSVSSAAKGNLCINGTACRPYTCGESIAPDPAARPYAFIEGKTILLGVVAARAHRISCEAGGSLALNFAVPDFPRSETVRASITDDQKQHVWELRLDARQIAEGVILAGRAGTYEALFVAGGYARLRTTIELARNRTSIAAKLAPLPILSGRIVDRASNAPMAGVLAITDTNVRTVSDAAGRFVLKADPEVWPKSIALSAAGYAEATIVVPPARASMSFGETSLSRGGSVVVHLRQPAAGTVVTLELHQLRRNGHQLGALTKSVTVPRAEKEVALRFDAIEPGDYLLLAKGDDEWEQLGETVTIAAAEESRASLDVAPFELRLQTLFEGKPLEGARVVLRNRDMFWTGGIPMNAGGKATVALWQGGRLNATVESPGMAPYLERRTLSDGEDVEWLLSVPSLEITGVVVNAETGDPVPDASLVLSMHSVEGYMLSVTTNAGADGTFRFAPVAHGEHTLKAAARGFPPVEMTYSFAEPEQRRSVTVKVDPAAPVKLTVVDERGAPIAGARVMDFSGTRRLGIAVTDAAGVVPVMVPQGATRDVYVIPRNGSFGFIRMRGTSENATLRLADGTARLVLRAESEAHEPIPEISVSIRRDGVFLPFEVVRALESAHGSHATSNREGVIELNLMPPGVYEFWPAGSEEGAPVRIVAAGGESTAVLTFARVEP